MKRIKKVAVAIVYILLALVLTYNIYNFVNIKVLGNDMTSVLGYSMLEVVSGSMEPTIHVGDMIIIDTKDDDYNANDIVTFYDENGSFVTHRIISRVGTMVTTKGDNNDSLDPEFATDRIVGKYVFKIQGLGFMFKALQSPITMILVLIVGVLVCVLVSTDSEGNPIKSEEEKEFEEFLKAKNELEIKAKEKVEASLEDTKEIVRKPIKRPKKVEEKSKTEEKNTVSDEKPQKEVKVKKTTTKKSSLKDDKKTETAKKKSSTKSSIKTASDTQNKTAAKTARATNKTETAKKTTKKVASSSPKKIEGKKTTKTTAKTATKETTKTKTTSKAATKTDVSKTAKKETVKTQKSVAKKPSVKTTNTKKTSSKKNDKK